MRTRYGGEKFVWEKLPKEVNEATDGAKKRGRPRKHPRKETCGKTPLQKASKKRGRLPEDKAEEYGGLKKRGRRSIDIKTLVQEDSCDVNENAKRTRPIKRENKVVTRKKGRPRKKAAVELKQSKKVVANDKQVCKKSQSVPIIEVGAGPKEEYLFGALMKSEVESIAPSRKSENINLTSKWKNAFKRDKLPEIPEATDHFMTWKTGLDNSKETTVPGKLDLMIGILESAKDPSQSPIVLKKMKIKKPEKEAASYNESIKSSKVLHNLELDRNEQMQENSSEIKEEENVSCEQSNIKDAPSAPIPNNAAEMFPAVPPDNTESCTISLDSRTNLKGNEIPNTVIPFLTDDNRNKTDNYPSKCHLTNQPTNVTTSLPKKMFACDKCDARFPNKFYLSRHTAKTHSKAKDVWLHECQICNKRFKERATFVIHRQMHDSKFISCDLCRFVTTRKNAMVAHMETHRKQGQTCNYPVVGETGVIDCDKLAGRYQ